MNSETDGEQPQNEDPAETPFGEDITNPTPGRCRLSFTVNGFETSATAMQLQAQLEHSLAAIILS